MPTRQLLLMVTIVAGIGCAKKNTQPGPRSSNNENPPPARAAPGAAAPRPSARAVTITAADAKARKMPAVGFTVDPGKSPWSATKFPEKDCYLRLSGPPGGPLLFEVWTFPHPKASGATLENRVRALFSKAWHKPLIVGKTASFTLAGKPRPALPATTGKSLSRTAWCAVLAASASKPPIEVLVLFGHSAGAPPKTHFCQAVAAHPHIRILLHSFRFLP